MPYWQRFLAPGVVRDFERMLRLQELAMQRGLPSVAADIDLVIAGLARGLERQAAKTTAIADNAIREALQKSLDRPETTSRSHLRERVHSKVLRARLGEVGIASIEELDKAVNPERPGSGTYWRAIEFGLSEGFVGRRLVGAFYVPGGPDRPFGPYSGRQAEFHTGLGDGSPVDLKGSERDSDQYGPMVISKPIKAHRFLEGGTQRAATDYLRGITDLSLVASKRLDRIVPRPSPRAGRRRR